MLLNICVIKMLLENFVPDCVSSNVRECIFKIFLGGGMPPDTPSRHKLVSHTTIILLPFCPPHLKASESRLLSIVALSVLLYQLWSAKERFTVKNCKWTPPYQIHTPLSRCVPISARFHVILCPDPSLTVVCYERFTHKTSFTIVFLHMAILCKYHHSTKLYQKISRVCCSLYFYECAARVIMPTATNE